MKKHTKIATIIASLTFLIFISLKNLDDDANQNISSINVKTNDQIIPRTLKNEINQSNSSNNFSKATLTCQNFLLPLEVNKAWQEENKEKLKALFLTLINNGLTGEELEHVTLITQIYPPDIKALIGLYNLNDASFPVIAGNKGKKISEALSWVLYNTLVDNNVDGFIATVKKKQMTNNSYLIGPAGNYSLISSILTTNVPLTDKAIAASKLIKPNAQITYLDLFIATEQGMPVEFVEKLWLASKLNPSFVLMFKQNEKSLAQVAMENGHVALLDFWLDHNSARVIEPLKSTLLDLLDPSFNMQDEPLQTELFLTLMRHNVQANRSNTAYKIKAWLDAEIYDQYKSTLEQKDPYSLKVLDSPQVKSAINEVFTSVLKPQIIDEKTLNKQHPCFQTEAIRVIHSIFDNLINTDQKNVETELAPYKPFNNINPPSQIKLLSMDSQDALSIVGKNKTIFAKNAIVNYQYEKIQQKLNISKANQISNEDQAEIDNNLNLIELAMAGQWQSVIAALDDNNYPPEVIDMVMMYAIEKKQSASFIIEIHRYGGNFGVAVMLAVVKINDVSLAIKLASYGLNFHQRTSSGRNAISAAVTGRKIEMLRYLLNENVSVKPHAFGYDPLDDALRQLKYFPKDMTFVELLIQAGSPIEPSHKEIILGYFNANIELYNSIIITYPELKSTF